MVGIMLDMAIPFRFSLVFALGSWICLGLECCPGDALGWSCSLSLFVDRFLWIVFCGYHPVFFHCNTNIDVENPPFIDHLPNGFHKVSILPSGYLLHSHGQSPFLRRVNPSINRPWLPWRTEGRWEMDLWCSTTIPNKVYTSPGFLYHDKLRRSHQICEKVLSITTLAGSCLINFQLDYIHM
jgi:hypothetical protein